jgi:hypothetical protein
LRAVRARSVDEQQDDRERADPECEYGEKRFADIDNR